MSADTPLMQQYKKIKEEYPNEILMYRLGDFYEMFFEDAKIASKELGLTLTKRNKEKGQDVPLAGVPYHSVASYIAKLVEKGYSIAICDQVEDPKSATGIVKREVTRVITPGTIIDVDFLYFLLELAFHVRYQHFQRLCRGLFLHDFNGSIRFTLLGE